VAGFHTSTDPTAEPWPAAEGMPKPATPTPEAPVPHNRRRTDQPAEAEAAEPSLLDGLDTFGADLDEDDDEDHDRYTPPPPPPLPHFSKYAVIGVLGVIVGFVLFLFPWLLPINTDYVTLLGFAAIVSGAVMLVWRLRSGDDEDRDDDGAVV
jgi:hypothetical protein